MEILQLRYFYESAQNESFTKTAEKYMVPPSSVSSSVRQLEKELGCKLFDRTCNRISLNSNGQKLKHTLHMVFSNLDNVTHELSLAAFDTKEINLLVKAMRSDITDYIIEFNKINPHISFNIVFDFDEKDFDEYDVIIDKMSDIYHDYDKFEQFNVKMELNVNKDNPLVSRKLTMKQLSNRPFLIFNEHCNMHSMLLENCEKAGFVPNIVAKINDVLCYEKMISSDFGIGLICENGYNSKDIKSLDVVDFDGRYQVFTYYKKDNSSRNIAEFLKFLKEKHK